MARKSMKSGRTAPSSKRGSTKIFSNPLVQKRGGRKKGASPMRAWTNPPVLVRDPTGYVGTQAVASKKRAKRRFDLTLNAQGSAISLPALPLVNVGLRWVSLIFTGLLIFLIYYVLTSPTFRVEAAEVNGTRRIPTMAVNNSLTMIGKSVFILDSNEIGGQILEQYPEFSSVEVDISLPNKVVISVSERIPVITWVEPGQTNLVDMDGFAFPGRGDTFSYPPVLVEASSSPPTPFQLTPEQIMEAAYAEENQDEENAEEEQVTEEPIKIGAQPFLSQDLVITVVRLSMVTPEDTPLLYDGSYGFGWSDPRGWEVYIGNAEDIDLKLKVYGAIVERMLVEGIQPALISVEHVDAPFYRLDR